MAAERYVPKRISELDAHSDRKICIAGIVKEVKPDGNFVINDGADSIEIINDSKADHIKPESKLRVFATNYDGKIKAEIIQDLNNADLSLYNRMLDLSKKAGLR